MQRPTQSRRTGGSSSVLERALSQAPFYDYAMRKMDWSPPEGRPARTPHANGAAPVQTAPRRSLQPVKSYDSPLDSYRYHSPPQAHPYTASQGYQSGFSQRKEQQGGRRRRGDGPEPSRVQQRDQPPQPQGGARRSKSESQSGRSSPSEPSKQRVRSAAHSPEPPHRTECSPRTAPPKPKIVHFPARMERLAFTWQHRGRGRAPGAPAAPPVPLPDPPHGSPSTLPCSLEAGSPRPSEAMTALGAVQAAAASVVMEWQVDTLRDTLRGEVHRRLDRATADLQAMLAAADTVFSARPSASNHTRQGSMTEEQEWAWSATEDQLALLRAATADFAGWMAGEAGARDPAQAARAFVDQVSALGPVARGRGAGGGPAGISSWGAEQARPEDLDSDSDDAPPPEPLLSPTTPRLWAPAPAAPTLPHQSPGGGLGVGGTGGGRARARARTSSPEPPPPEAHLSLVFQSHGEVMVVDSIAPAQAAAGGPLRTRDGAALLTDLVSGAGAEGAAGALPGQRAGGDRAEGRPQAEPALPADPAPHPAASPAHLPSAGSTGRLSEEGPSWAEGEADISIIGGADEGRAGAGPGLGEEPEDRPPPPAPELASGPAALLGGSGSLIRLEDSDSLLQELDHALGGRQLDTSGGSASGAHLSSLLEEVEEGERRLEQGRAASDPASSRWAALQDAGPAVDPGAMEATAMKDRKESRSTMHAHGRGAASPSPPRHPDPSKTTKGGEAMGARSVEGPSFASPPRPKPQGSPARAAPGPSTPGDLAAATNRGPSPSTEKVAVPVKASWRALEAEEQHKRRVQARAQRLKAQQKPAADPPAGISPNHSGGKRSHRRTISDGDSIAERAYQEGSLAAMPRRAPDPIVRTPDQGNSALSSGAGSSDDAGPAGGAAAEMPDVLHGTWPRHTSRPAPPDHTPGVRRSVEGLREEGGAEGRPMNLAELAALPLAADPSGSPPPPRAAPSPAAALPSASRWQQVLGRGGAGEAGSHAGVAMLVAEVQRGPAGDGGAAMAALARLVERGRAAAALLHGPRLQAVVGALQRALVAVPGNMELEQEGWRMLVALTGNVVMQHRLSEHAVVREGQLAQLLTMVLASRREHKAPMQGAAQALRNLALVSPAVQRQVMEHGGVRSLLAVLEAYRESPETCGAAVEALLACALHNRELMAHMASLHAPMQINAAMRRHPWLREYLSERFKELYPWLEGAEQQWSAARSLASPPLAPSRGAAPVAHTGIGRSPPEAILHHTDSIALSKGKKGKRHSLPATASASPVSTPGDSPGDSGGKKKRRSIFSTIAKSMEKSVKTLTGQKSKHASKQASPHTPEH